MPSSVTRKSASKFAWVILATAAYIAYVVAWATHARQFIFDGHDVAAIPDVWWVAGGPAIALVIGHSGFFYFVLATAVCLPCFAVAAYRGGRAGLLWALLGAGLWVLFGLELGA